MQQSHTALFRYVASAEPTRRASLERAMGDLDQELRAQFAAVGASWDEPDERLDRLGLAGMRFVLHLPVDVGVVQALVVRVRGAELALPLACVAQVAQVPLTAVASVDGRACLRCPPGWCRSSSSARGPAGRGASGGR
jgi:hypothetical protein